MPNELERRYSGLASAFPRIELATLPTPVLQGQLDSPRGTQSLSIKCDNLTSSYYGGNKVRKLEYLLHRARSRGASRVATFGAVASNHAMATSLFSQREGFTCTTLLSHQTRTPATARSLNMHLKIGSRVVRYGGDYANRVSTLRRELYNEKTWVIPLGGTCWLGALGFVDAALELARQVDEHLIEKPDKIYVAMGTMGTVSGLALGLALAGLDTEVQAIRVTDIDTANEKALGHLTRKMAELLSREDESIPGNIADKARMVVRHEFFGAGYAKTNPAVDEAVQIANEQLDLTLEPTYTGKTMSALINDIPSNKGKPVLFWNTYNSNPLPTDTSMPDDTSALPEQFLSYFD